MAAIVAGAHPAWEPAGDGRKNRPKTYSEWLEGFTSPGEGDGDDFPRFGRPLKQGDRGEFGERQRGNFGRIVFF